MLLMLYDRLFTGSFLCLLALSLAFLFFFPQLVIDRLPGRGMKDHPNASLVQRYVNFTCMIAVWPIPLHGQPEKLNLVEVGRLASSQLGHLFHGRVGQFELMQL